MSKDLGTNIDFSQNDFLRLLTRNQQQIRGYISIMVADPADVDDIMQETALVLWQKYAEYDPTYPFATWGIGIARRLIKKHYRIKQHNRQRFRREVVMSLLAYESMFTEEADDRIEVLKDCIQELKERDKKTIFLRFYQELSIKKMGQELQRPAHGLYRTLTRISRILQSCVQQKMNLRQA